MNSILLSLALLVFSLTAAAQPAVEAQVGIPGAGFALINSCVSLGESGFAYAGTFLDNGSAHAWYVRSNSEGQNTSARHYGDAQGTESAQCLARLPGGTVMLAGGTSSFARELGDIWLLRVSPEGDSIWSGSYSAGRDEWAVDMVTTGDGGIAVLARSSTVQNMATPVTLLLKFNQNIELQWTRTFEVNFPNEPYRLLETSDGGYVIAGWKTIQVQDEPSEYWLRRLNSGGDSFGRRSIQVSMTINGS